MMKTLLAFHNDKSIKVKYLARVVAHQQADEIIQGQGWTGTKGCAVGCTLNSYNVSRYPKELGIPEWLGRLEDSIHEGLPLEQAKQWPGKFLRAINVGANLEPVRHQLTILRMDRLLKLLETSQYPAVEDVRTALLAVRRCAEAEVNGQSCDWSARSAASSAARSAAESAAWSAWSAAWSAARSAARSAAWSAAGAAASAAASAARSAASAASAADAAASAAASAARSAAESAAESAAWIQESTDLLKLLRACK
jgi:hypothetical protein